MSASDAVAWARAQLGKTENPAGSNKGPGITQWEIDSGYEWVERAAAGVPWCQCFANAAARQGGCPQLRDGFTPTVLNGSHEGWKRVSVDEAEPGDFMFFKWPGVSNFICDHVGVLVAKTDTTVTCIEGNTSPDSNGSQNNGGGVYLRTRSRTLTPGAVAPPYPNKEPYRNFILGMRGDDVTAFQVAISLRAERCGRPDRKVTVDGQYGSETKENGAWAAYILGVGESTSQIKEGGISADVQRWVRNPDSRNDTQKERASSRRELYCR